MAGSFCRRGLLTYRNYLLHTQKRTGYVVLIPETPSEVADLNFVSLESLPDFSKLTKKNCTYILNEYAQQYDEGTWEIHEHLEKQLKTLDSVNVFKNIIEPLEVLVVPLLTSWGVTRTLFLADKQLMPPTTYASLSNRVIQIRNDKFSRKTTYTACKNNLEKDNDKLTEEQKKVLQKYIWEGFHCGFELDMKNQEKLRKAYEIIQNKSKVYESKYWNSVSSFKQIISDISFKNEAPLDLLRNSSIIPQHWEKGPWMIKLYQGIYDRFLETCSSRDGRLHVWLAYNQIASQFLDTSCNATVEVEGIRQQRQYIAEILGYPTYAHLSMETKMAKSVEQVQIVLSELLESAKFGQEREIYELEKFAYSNKFEGSLELWDLPYWKRKEREIKLGLDEEKLKEYFPLGQVILGLIALCEQLFGIEIEEQSGVDCWEPEVRYFRVSDEKTKAIIGGFYLDPYARPQKSISETNDGWFVPIRPRSKVIASLPLSSIIFSFTPPTDKQPSLLYYREIQSLFARFGDMLLFTLSEANYSDAVGLSNVEWDAIGISSNFLKFWLSEKGTLESISGHYETGEPLPKHVLTTLCETHKHMAGTTLSQEIYYSNLDLYMHLRPTNSVALVKELWDQHFLFNLHPKDCHPFGMKSIFLTPLAASIYGRVWSKMVAADIFCAFTESELSITEVAALGKKFRATFLSSGGGCDSSTVFRRFRGRDPDPRSLIRLLGLPTASYFEPESKPNLSLPEADSNK